MFDERVMIVENKHGCKVVWLPVCIVCLVLPFWNIFISCLRHHITQYAQRSNSTTTTHACTDDNILSFKSFPNKSLPTNTIYHLNCQAIQILVQMFLLF